MTRRYPHHLFWLAMLLAGISAVTACGGDQDVSCATDSDCFKGEICSEDDVCVADPDGPSNGSTNAGINAENAHTENNTSDNSRSNSQLEGACIVDPFQATCTNPDDNDDFGEYLEFDPSPPGCSGSGDDFTGNEMTVEALQICANETRDRYDTNLLPCRNKTFIIEVTLTPKQDCDPDRYTFDVGVQGNDCEEPNDKVRCELLEDGRKRVTAMVSPSNAIAVARIDVEKNVEDLQFDYDLDLVVRE